MIPHLILKLGIGHSVQTNLFFRRRLHQRRDIIWHLKIRLWHHATSEKSEVGKHLMENPQH